MKAENQLIRFDAASDWNMARRQVIDWAVAEWRVCLIACFKAGWKHFEHKLWSAVSQLSIISY